MSNQAGLLATKNRIKAHLLAIRLYKHDPVLSLNAMGHIFLENGRYFLCALKPAIVMIIPVVIIIIQLSVRYGYQPVEVDQPELVSVRVADSIELKDVHIAPALGLRIDAPPLIIPSAREIFWRIYPLESGTKTLTFEYSDQREYKRLVVGKRRNLVSAKRLHASTSALFYPTEKTLSKI